MTLTRIQYLGVAGACFVMCSGFLFGKQEKKTEIEEVRVAPVSADVPTAVPAVGETTVVGGQQGKVVYAFAGEEEMREFAGLWQQRRGIITRMAVLEAYLSEEAARMQEINRIYTEEYGINIDMRFVLDSDRGILVELEESEASQSEGQ